MALEPADTYSFRINFCAQGILAASTAMVCISSVGYGFPKTRRPSVISPSPHLQPVQPMRNRDIDPNYNTETKNFTLYSVQWWLSTENVSLEVGFLDLCDFNGK